MKLYTVDEIVEHEMDLNYSMLGSNEYCVWMLVGTHEGRKIPGSSGYARKDNIKMDVIEILWGDPFYDQCDVSSEYNIILFRSRFCFDNSRCNLS
jgi:hypothetical protein